MKCVNKVLPVCLIVLGLVCAGCEPSSTAQLEENKALVRRAVEEMGKQNWQHLRSCRPPTSSATGRAVPKHRQLRK